jgi:hypothetical protein
VSRNFPDLTLKIVAWLSGCVVLSVLLATDREPEAEVRSSDGRATVVITSERQIIRFSLAVRAQIASITWRSGRANSDLSETCNQGKRGFRDVAMILTHFHGRCFPRSLLPAPGR